VDAPDLKECSSSKATDQIKEKTHMRTTMLMLIAVGTIAVTGCATSGRYVLLKEYSPTVPAKVNSPLDGVTVSIQNFQEEFNIKDKIPNGDLDEPVGFPFTKMTASDERAWNQELKALKKSSLKKDWREIGNVRNGFGAVLSKVYAVNPAGEWLTNALKLDLEAQGARVIDDAHAADATVSVDGAIRFFKIDMYMAYKSDLVVTMQLKVKDKPPIPLTIHTRAGGTAWSSSSYEYFQCIRLNQQKFSRVLIDEIEKALKT
jgi:hypothetical protein